MSPLDDELRAALHGRAQVLTPSPDPLAGIEKRARRMRRHRAGAAVVGSALAVALVAVAVPAVQSAVKPTQRDAPSVARSSAPDLDLSRYALDPADPWELRGRPVSMDDRALIQREYATRTGGAEVLVTPLYGGYDESADRNEVVFLAEVDGSDRWGVAAYPTEAGLEILWDEPLPEPALALAAALPGDEVPRLLVLASPEAGLVFYGTEGSDEASVGEDGLAVAALERDPTSDFYRVLADGDELVRAEAPDPPDDAGARSPVNLLDWPSRGTSDAALEAVLIERYQAAVEGLDGEPTDAGVRYRPLFTGDTDAGVRFTVGQAWVTGREAHTVSLAVGGESGEQFLLGPATDPDTRVVAQLLCCQPGATVDTLVVVPVPGTGQVLYDDDATGEFRPVGQGQDVLDGVVLLDRDPRADADRLQLLDGDGDPVRPLFQGPVFNLLCGLKECG